MGKKRTSEPRHGDTVIRAIRAGIENLMEKHYPDIEKFSEEASSKKVKVGLAATLDFSQADPNVTVVIGFTKAVKDKVSIHLTDPNQGKFQFISDVPDDEEDEVETGADQATVEE